MSTATQNEIRDTSPLLSSREAARWLGVSERSLHRLKQAGSIPYIRVGPRRILFRRDSLVAWAEQAETRDEPEPEDDSPFDRFGRLKDPV